MVSNFVQEIVPADDDELRPGSQSRGRGNNPRWGGVSDLHSILHRNRQPLQPGFEPRLKFFLGDTECTINALKPGMAASIAVKTEAGKSVIVLGRAHRLKK